MNNSITRITLDVSVQAKQACISLRQFDTMRRLVFSLVDRGVPYVFEEGVYAYLSAKTSAETYVFGGTTIQDGAVHFDVPASMTLEEGEIQCELILSAADHRILNTSSFDIIVFHSNGADYADDAIASDNFFAMVEATNGANDIARILNEKLENGEFKGDKGDKGDKGEKGEGFPPITAADADKVLTANEDGTAGWKESTGGDIVTVNFQMVNGFYNADKTTAELIAAHVEGKALCAVIAGTMVTTSYFASIRDKENFVGYIEFEYCDSDAYRTVTLNNTSGADKVTRYSRSHPYLPTINNSYDGKILGLDGTTPKWLDPNTIDNSASVPPINPEDAEKVLTAKADGTAEWKRHGALYDGTVTATDTGNGNVLGNLGVVIPLTQGAAYKVTFNGKDYKCVGSKEDIYPYLGNAHFLISSAEDTGEPFCLTFATNTTYLRTNEAGSYTLTIYEPTSGAYSWNDLKDKPFGEETVNFGDTLTWDGTPSDVVVSVEADATEFHHVSDCTPSAEELIGAHVVFNEIFGADIGAADIVPLDENFNLVYLNGEPIVVIAYEDGKTASSGNVSLVMPRKGIYFLYLSGDYTVFTTALQIDGYQFTKTTIHKIDAKYLPQSIVGVTNLHVIDASDGNIDPTTMDLSAYGKGDVIVIVQSMTQEQ